MKTVTLTVHRRPWYLRRVLESLVENDLEGWKVHLGVEPGDRRDDALKVIAETLGGKVDHEIILNDRRLGVRDHPYHLLDRVFSRDSELNLYLEEDTIVSPDVTPLAHWYRTQDLRGTVCLNLMHGVCGGSQHLSRPFPSLIVRTRLFNSLGFILTRDQWLDHFKPYWLSESPGCDGWDWSVYLHNFRARTDLRTLQPLLPRANHIGRENGTHCASAFHDAVFAGLRINQARGPFDYRIWPPERTLRPP